MSTGGPMRLFVAVYPPAEAVRAMLRALRRLNLAGTRVTPAEQVHLTLLFIGETQPRELERVRESVARSAAGVEAGALKPLRLITLPEGRTPRLVAVETDAPAPVIEVQRRLAVRLARPGRGREGERFRPHLTLCRFSHTARAGRVDEPIEAEPFRVESVALVRSVLRREGAEHAVVEEFRLG
jgi:2'-5' RNA ligase